MALFKQVLVCASLLVLAGRLNAAGLPNTPVEAGSWDWKGYMPFEATGPLPVELREAVRLLRVKQAVRALPLLREYHRKNPRDFRGINALIQGAKMSGQHQAYYRQYRARVLREGASLQDRYGFVMSGYAVGPERNRRDQLLFTQQADRLWENRKGNLGPTVAATFLIDEDVTFWTWRARMDQFAQEHPENAYLALLRGLNYASGYSVVAVYPNPDGAGKSIARSTVTEPKYDTALTIFRTVRRKHPSWSIPMFQEARCLAYLNRTQEAIAAFKRYLGADPPPESRQARKARAFIGNPERQSLFLPEDLEEKGVQPSRRTR